MKISYNWLRDYIDIPSNPEETAHILTFCGLEVEAIESISAIEGNLEGVLIGEVLSCDKHPDADRLTLCQVDYGQGPVQIVCGAPNVAPGQKVVVATPGSRLYPDGKELLIKKSKIRGQESSGMICAEDELGLGKSHDGIMVLEPSAAIGMEAASYFGLMPDSVFEIGLTPNRSDAASHIGTARDLHAYFSIQDDITSASRLRLPELDSFRIDDTSLPIAVEIQDKEACPRYSGISISGIRVGHSPAWLQDKLKAVGLRPLNNVVDITNFVLMELGHPLHAFDAGKIRGQRVVIRAEREGTPFITLDGITRNLSSEDLMICDAEGGMCIAGVFGGESSGVSEATTTVFLESAYFSPSHIRRTARRHGLNTDASFRFERGADPEMTIVALKRAAMLIREICGGRISSDIVDIYPEPILPRTISLRRRSLERMAGCIIPSEIVEKILNALGFKINSKNEEGWELLAPLFKADVSREADVMEEILRIYGYNNIPLPAQISFPPDVASYGDEESLRNVISDSMVARGFSEAMNNSLSSSAYAALGIYDGSLSVQMMNALSSELDVLRQSLLPGLLETLSHNINRQHKDLRFFEFGTVYSKKSETGSVTERYNESKVLSIIISGKSFPENWRDPNRKSSIFDLRHELEMVFSGLGLSPEYSGSEDRPPFQSVISYRTGNKELAYCGQISQVVLQRFGIEQAVFYAEVDYEVLSKRAAKVKTEFSPLPRFPEVRRDLALVIDKSCSYASMEQSARKLGRPYLKDVNLFDVFEGESLGSGKVSYAMSFILRDEQSTLTEKQIEDTMSRILSGFEKEFGAKLR
jgi:phenylalanyl-tRNA synthetase beta chain